MRLSNTDFIKTIFANAPDGGMPWVASFDKDPLKADGRQWRGFALTNGSLRHVRDDYNNFMAISAFKSTLHGIVYRRKENFTSCHLLMVDDVGTKIEAWQIALEPSYKLETSPGNYQYGYLIDPPETNRELVERVQDAMVAQGLATDGKDPGMKGVTRYGRLPVGRNTKSKYVERLGGQPFVHQLEEWNPERRFTLQEIIEAFELTLDKAKPKQESASDDPIYKALEERNLILEQIREGVWRIVCPWYLSHTDRAESGTAYFAPGYGGYTAPGFKCHHGHCADRTIKDLLQFLGMARTDAPEKNQKVPKLIQVLGLLREQWAGRLRFNTFTQKRELDGREINDSNITQIREALDETTGRDFAKDMTFDAVYLVCQENSYDPLVDYLNGLEWDGVPRVDTWLSDVYGAEQTEYTTAAGRCWLISGVARGFEPGCKVRLVLLIQGHEDLGKSLSLVHLCPRREWFTDSLPADLHSKDAAIGLSGKWIVESPEMASMRRSEQESIKAFLSRDVDDYRPAYGRCNTQVPRRCILACTTNPDDVLSAREENTRYLPIKATEYSQDYMSYNRDQLWAEAVVLYRDGVKWWLTDSNAKEQARIARRLFVETDPWDDNIKEWLETRSLPAEPAVTVAEVLDHLQIELAHHTKRDEMRITSIFKKLGWEKGHTRTGKKWRPAGK